MFDPTMRFEIYMALKLPVGEVKELFGIDGERQWNLAVTLAKGAPSWKLEEKEDHE